MILKITIALIAATVAFIIGVRMIAHRAPRPDRMGVVKGRSTRKNLKVGICGEHGGDPRLFDFPTLRQIPVDSAEEYQGPSLLRGFLWDRGALSLPAS